MAQGFVRDLNLIESDTGALDRGILDNLGGPNITNDLLLFDGNFKFISKLVPADYSVSGDTVTVSGEGKVAFSDGTKISMDGGSFAGESVFEYEVFDSNGIDKFRVKDGFGSVTPAGTLRRNDGVSFQNLSNLSSKRLEASSSSSTGVGADDGASDLFNVFNASEQVDYISGQLGIYYYKRGRIPLTFEDSIFDQKVTFRGQVMIVDSDATVSSVPDSNSPGLFIIDANDPTATAVRAFSDASNPWDNSVAGKLVTTQAVSQPNVLTFEPTSSNVPNFISSGSPLLIDSENNTLASYTHKLPVVVNGTTFFLLLKNS